MASPAQWTQPQLQNRSDRSTFMLRAYHFFEFTSLSTAMFSAWSATILFKRRFSSSKGSRLTFQVVQFSGCSPSIKILIYLRLLMNISIAQFAVTRGDAATNLVRISDLCAKASSLWSRFTVLTWDAHDGFWLGVYSLTLTRCGRFDHNICIILQVLSMPRMDLNGFGTLT